MNGQTPKLHMQKEFLVAYVTPDSDPVADTNKNRKMCLKEYDKAGVLDKSISSIKKRD